MPLTSREVEVLLLLADGQSTIEIAQELFLSSETIKTYRRNLLVKLDAKNVANLIRKAFDKRVITINNPTKNMTCNFRKDHELVA